MTHDIPRSARTALRNTGYQGTSYQSTGYPSTEAPLSRRQCAADAAGHETPSAAASAQLLTPAPIVIVVVSPIQALIPRIEASIRRQGAVVHQVVGNLRDAQGTLARVCPTAVVAHIDALSSTSEPVWSDLGPSGAHTPMMVVAPAAQALLLADVASRGAMACFSLPLSDDQLGSALGRAQALHILHLRDQLRDGGRPISNHELAQLESQFRTVMAGLYMVWQPIYSAHTFQAMGYEALVRTTASSAPTARQVLDLATRMGRLAWLEHEVLDACQQQVPYLDPADTLFVNVTVEQFMSGSLGTDRDPLAASAARVVLEVTGDQPVPDTEVFARQSARLRQAGYRIALPELGSGRDFLARMLALQPDVYKLGPRAWSGCKTDARKHRHVRTMIQMARSEGAQVVAEGIETLAQARTAMELGCDLLQGYLLGRPLPRSRWGGPAAQPGTNTDTNTDTNTLPDRASEGTQ